MALWVFARKSIALFAAIRSSQVWKELFAWNDPEVSHHGDKCFLANFLGIFVAEVAGKLEDEAGGDTIVFVEQRVPGLRIAALASGD